MISLKKKKARLDICTKRNFEDLLTLSLFLYVSVGKQDSSFHLNRSRVFLNAGDSFPHCSSKHGSWGRSRDAGGGLRVEANPFPRGTDGFPRGGCSRGLWGAFLGAQGQAKPLGSSSATVMSLRERFSSRTSPRRNPRIWRKLGKAAFGINYTRAGMDLPLRGKESFGKRDLVDLEIQDNGSCMSWGTLFVCLNSLLYKMHFGIQFISPDTFIPINPSIGSQHKCRTCPVNLNTG